MPYTTQTWADNDATKPLSAARMNYIETGIASAQSTAEAAGSAASTTTASPQPKRSLTTTRTTITASAVTSKTVFIKAAAANTQVVYIGDVTVTSAGGGNVQAELMAGDGMSMDVSSTGSLYGVSASGTQAIYVGVMT